MSIVCGTDFSESSEQAMRAAARLAARMQLPLHLVHAASASSAWSSNLPDSEVLQRAERKLRKEAERLSAIVDRIEVHVRPEPPDEALLELAGEVSAKLIVVAALGHRRAGKWQIGSHSERLAQRAHVPVLVVRDADAFEAWTSGARPLRILLGVDPSLTSDAAMRWVGELRQFGACDVTVLYLYWPPAQYERLGLHGIRDYADPDPEVTKTLNRELRQRLASAFDASSVRIRLEPHMGRIGDRIALLAEEDRADLVVVGSHERDAFGRAIAGSASRDALHRARMAVVCVPASSPERKPVPDLRSVLVATDFSATGNAAVALAYAAAAHGGTLHLVHVVSEQLAHPAEPHDIFTPADAHPAQRALLEALIPKDAERKGIVTILHVIAAGDVASAIAQAAERLGVQAIALGTHGRSGLSKLLLGSIAQAVLQRTQRSLIFARTPTV